MTPVVASVISSSSSSIHSANSFKMLTTWSEFWKWPFRPSLSLLLFHAPSMLYHRKWPFIHEERKGGVKTVAELRSQTTSWMAQQIEGGRGQQKKSNALSHSLGQARFRIWTHCNSKEAVVTSKVMHRNGEALGKFNALNQKPKFATITSLSIQNTKNVPPPNENFPQSFSPINP